MRFKFRNCLVRVVSAVSSGKSLRLRRCGRDIEWSCPECGQLNRVAVRELSYEFGKGGDDWSRVIKYGDFAFSLNKVLRRRKNLIEFLVRLGELRRQHLFFAGREVEVKPAAAARIELHCKRCDRKVILNAEISAAKEVPAFLVRSVEPAKITTADMEDLDVEVSEGDGVETWRRILVGYSLFQLFKRGSLELRMGRGFDNILRLVEWGNYRWQHGVEEFFKRLNGWIHDLERLNVLDEVDRKADETLAGFETGEISLYIGDIRRQVQEAKTRIRKRLRRLVFVNLGWFKEQVDKALFKLKKRRS